MPINPPAPAPTKAEQAAAKALAAVTATRKTADRYALVIVFAVGEALGFLIRGAQ